MAVRQFSTLAAMHFIEMRGIFRRRRRARLPCCDATSKVTQERLRLASDLHDTVGHGLILIAMQARHLSTSSPSLRSQQNLYLSKPIVIRPTQRLLPLKSNIPSL